MSLKPPLRSFRYNAATDRRPDPPKLASRAEADQSRPLTKSRSHQPSPSASKKTTPEPIVSGSHLPPARPLLCEKRMPAAAVTSVKVGAWGLGLAACEAWGLGLGAWEVPSAAVRTTAVSASPAIDRVNDDSIGAPSRARESSGARCCPRASAGEAER